MSRRRSSGIAVRVVLGGDGLGEAGRGVRVQLCLEPCPAPDAVDGLVPGRLDDPGPRELGDARGSPLARGGGKGLLRRLFGHVEVTDEPDQGGEDPAPIRPINRGDSRTCVRGHTPG